MISSKKKSNNLIGLKTFLQFCLLAHVKGFWSAVKEVCDELQRTQPMAVQLILHYKIQCKEKRDELRKRDYKREREITAYTVFPISPFHFYGLIAVKSEFHAYSHY